MLRRSSFPSLLDEFFGKDLWPDMADTEKRFSVPSVNIVEGNNEYRIEVAAPGLNKNDFKINVDNNMLTISSEKELKDEKKEEDFVRREFSYSSFSRSFALPEGSEQEKISASYKDGILNVTIPKRDEAKAKPSKQIKIS
jgi:HSP20 family protein